MTEDREDEPFLSRWSRRKLDARQTQDKPAEAATPPAAPAVSSAAPAASSAAGAQAGVSEPGELPPLESLKGLASEYRGFMQPGVDDNLRRSALRKLFSDPHFENFEKFEAYCEDYTQGEPIPLAMLKTLEHAKGLLFDEEKKEEKKEDEERVAEAPPTALPEPGKAAEPGVSARADSATAPAESEGKT
jgi:hypothetical protein